VANKATNLTSPDNTKYPTTQSVADGLALKTDISYQPIKISNITHTGTISTTKIGSITIPANYFTDGDVGVIETWQSRPASELSFTGTLIYINETGGGLMALFNQAASQRQARQRIEFVVQSSSQTIGWPSGSGQGLINQAAINASNANYGAIDWTVANTIDFYATNQNLTDTFFLRFISVSKR
jgi:hypothetical protein